MAAHKHCCGLSFWIYIIVIVGLVLFAGLMSGLTLGLMSLGRMDLEVLTKSGLDKDRKHAGHGAGDLTSEVPHHDVEGTKSQNSPSRRMKKYGSEDVVKLDDSFPPRFPEDEEVVGIITLEDVIEELLQEEIFDETDMHIDVMKLTSAISEEGQNKPVHTAASGEP